MKQILLIIVFVCGFTAACQAGEPGKAFGSITIPAAEAPVKHAVAEVPDGARQYWTKEDVSPEPPQTVYIETAPAPSVFDAVKTCVWDWPLGLASRSFRATGDLAADTIDAGRRFGGAVVTTAHEVQ